MCRFLPPPGRHHFGSPHGRYLQIFEIHWFFKKTCKKLKFWNPDGCVDFCRLRDGIISGASMAGTFRFLKFIGFNSKHAQSWNVEILMDVWIFAASGTASFQVRAWPVPSDFWNPLKCFDFWFFGPSRAAEPSGAEPPSRGGVEGGAPAPPSQRPRQPRTNMTSNLQSIWKEKYHL